MQEKSVEGVKRFINLGTTLTNKKWMHEEVQNSLQSGNACCHSVQNLEVATQKLRITIYTTITLPQVLLFIPTKSTQYIKYIYLSPITSYIFRCSLRHLQGEYCFICSRNI